MTTRVRFVIRKIRDNLCATTAIALALLPVARIFQGWVCRINSPREWDYTPAIMAIAVRTIRHGGLLYTDFLRPPYPAVNLYNPLAIYLAALLTPFFYGSPIAELEAGRLLVLSATIVVCMLIFHLTRRSGANTAAALILTIAFALSPLLQPWGFEFRVDMPALACELAGLYLFHAGLLILSGVAFVCAFFSKQSYVSGIAAVVLYCVLNCRWRHALTLSVIWFGSVAALTALLRWVYPDYLHNVYLGLDPSLNLSNTAGLLGRVVFWQFPLAAIAAFSVFRQGLRRNVAVCYIIVTLVTASGSSMRWGSNLYYFLPMLAGVVIVAGPPLSDLLERSIALSLPLKITGGATIAWVLIVPLLLAGVTDFSAIRRAITGYDFGCPYREGRPWDERALQLLDSVKGPVITDDFNLVLYDRHVEGLDLMTLRAMFDSGRLDDRPLVDEIERRRVTAFALDWQLLDRQWQGRELFWPRLRKAILDNYVPVPGLGPPYLMIPKPSTGASSSDR
jgi:hypothetical protein